MSHRNDVIELELETWSWCVPHAPPINGVAPRRFCCGGLGLVGGRYLVSIGGARVDEETNEPVAIPFHEKAIELEADGEESDDEVRHKMVPTGVVFDLGRNRWSQPQFVRYGEGHGIQDQLPDLTARHSYSIITIGSEVVIFGGSDLNGDMNNDLFTLHVSEAPDEGE